MKKTYLTPESRVKDLELEWNFLLSGGLDTGIGSLDDPEDDDELPCSSSPWVPAPAKKKPPLPTVS